MGFMVIKHDSNPYRSAQLKLSAQLFQESHESYRVGWCLEREKRFFEMLTYGSHHRDAFASTFG